jgi:ribosomal protein S19
VTWESNIIPVCVDLRILVYSGEYYIELLGDSSKCRGFIIVRANLHNYPTHKFVTGNNYLITYYILVTWESNTIPVCVDLRILVYSGEYYIELLGDSYKCRGFKMVSGVIHIYHRDK